MKRRNVFFKRSLKCLTAAVCLLLLFCGAVNFAGQKQNPVSAYAAEEGVEGFINRLYELILGRDADEEGLNTWTNLLLTGQRTGVGVAEGFILSDEFLNKSMSDEEFVEIMYRTFLDREADEGGLATWLGMMEQGYQKKFIFSGFANSDEFQTVCNGYGIERGFIELTEEEKRPVIPEGEQDVSQFVERLYSEILGRAADEEGLNTWVTLLENGEYSGAEVAEGFIMSDEFINTDMTDEEFVHIMYKTFFDRDADEGGLATWMNALEDGYSKRFVFAGFANSVEFGALCEDYGIEQGSVEVSVQVPQPLQGWQYYDQLESYEKQVYDWLLKDEGESAEFMLYDSELPKGMDKDTLQTILGNRVLQALCFDVPMLELKYDFLLVEYIEKEGCYKVTADLCDIPEYNYNKIVAILEQWSGVADKNEDSYTKIRKLYEVVADHIEYEYSLLGGESWAAVSYGEISGILHGYLVCSGYSAVVKEICDIWGIPCVRVSSVSHAWNMVQMEDGKWYIFDTTGIIPESWENYNTLKGLSSIEGNPEYIWSDMGVKDGCFIYPELAEEDYEYTGTNTEFSYMLSELDFEEGETKFVYEINEDGTTCTIVAYQGMQEGDLIVPEKIDGYTVTSIGNAAFTGCSGFDGQLVIPDTVTHIGEFAFYACNNLMGTIELPEHLEYLADGAFLRCNGFTGDISFPDSIRFIGAYSFAYCQGLNGDLYYPVNWEECYIGSKVFSYCENFNGIIYLPDNYFFDIEDFADTNFSGLSVSENSQLYSLADGALYNKEMTELVYCPANKEGILTIPEGVVKICDKAAMGCEKLIGVVFPNSLEYIGAEAFLNAVNIENLELPDRVSDIGELAFSSAVNGRLHIPNKITEIKRFTFFGISIEPVIIPNSVKILEQGALGGSFEYIVLSDNIEEMDTEAIIQNGVLGTIYYNEANPIITAVVALIPEYDWVAYSDRDELLKLLDK